MSIKWEKCKGGVTAEVPYMSGTLPFTIKKSVGGQNHKLYLGENTQPMLTKATQQDCKDYVKAYVSS